MWVQKRGGKKCGFKDGVELTFLVQKSQKEREHNIGLDKVRKNRHVNSEKLEEQFGFRQADKERENNMDSYMRSEENNEKEWE